MKKSYWGRKDLRPARAPKISAASEVEFPDLDSDKSADLPFLEQVESGLELETQDRSVPMERPNAVIKNGGPQLLRGFMLPLPPSANAYWTQSIVPRKVKGAERVAWPVMITGMKDIFTKLLVLVFPSTEAKQYVKMMTELALQRGFRFFTEKDLRMEIVVCPRDRRTIDCHNYIKVLCDAFQQVGVYQDDSQVKDVRVVLGPVIKDGRVVVSLWEITLDRDAVLKEAWR